MRALVLMSLLALGACGGDTPAPAEPEEHAEEAEEKVPEQVAKAVAARDKVLKGEEAGIDDAELDALLYEIAADPALSEAYQKAIQ